MFQIGLTGLLGSLGAVSKIVLLLLFVFSVVSWAIIFMKWRAFATADRMDQQFMGLLSKAKDLDDLCRQVRRMESSPAAVLFEGVMDRVTGLRGQDGGSLSADRPLIERTAAHLSHSQLSRLESYLPFLATTGNITPFIGLLGTVMGIIDAFREIGAQGTASIAAVAPGVAEALVATAAGLFTAIPAVIAYNYFLSRIRRTAFRLDTVTIELMTSLSVPMVKPKPMPVGAQR
ncbi:MAG TPA: MotA/TolQ/ExbB proton channel family protein [Nitrospira sp.]|nr:MotA/TolQ/ExbB proton channel family protein [Nitrospira sp.]